MTHRRIHAAWKHWTPALCLVSMLLLSMSPDTDRTLEFIPATYDFGVIKEDDGPAEGHVKAVNISADTTFITSIRTSCGCTGATYTEETIAPGDTATISFTYNPANRPGKFEKTIKAFTGEERIRNTFTIKGKVTASEESLRKAYPYEQGGLWLSSIIVDAGKVHRDELLPLFIGVHNPAEAGTAVRGASDCGALEVSLIPDTIAAHDLGSLTMVLKAKKLPAATKEFRLKAYIIDTQTADTLASIPVGGYIVP